MDTSTSICWRCINHREVVSGKGSTFLLCKVSLTDEDELKLPSVDEDVKQELLANRTRWPKYPPQPLGHCPFYVLQEI